MPITLTFTAETPLELDAQVRSYIDGQGAIGTSSVVMPSPDDLAGGAVSPTNDDYRRAIRAIPRGRVAAYGVVSEVVRGDRDGSQKVAGLAANDPALETAYRVVKLDGSVAAGFRWSDGRMGGADEGRRVLEEEGIEFDVHGRALPEFMLSAAELREYYEGQED
jgi:alkylated DNA nucleotide flippase Atl1